MRPWEEEAERSWVNEVESREEMGLANRECSRLNKE